jgi:hypothetical protein
LLINDIQILIGIGIIIVTSAGAVFGTIKFAIPHLKDGLGRLGKRIGAAEVKMESLVKTHVFEKEIQRMEGMCENHRLACQTLLCSRIKDVRGDLKTMDEKRESARIGAVPRQDFEQYKTQMQRDVRAIEKKIDNQNNLLTRLDERVYALLKKANGGTLPT